MRQQPVSAAMKAAHKSKVSSDRRREEASESLKQAKLRRAGATSTPSATADRSEEGTSRDAEALKVRCRVMPRCRKHIASSRMFRLHGIGALLSAPAGDDPCFFTHVYTHMKRAVRENSSARGEKRRQKEKKKKEKRGSGNDSTRNRSPSPYSGSGSDSEEVCTVH